MSGSKTARRGREPSPRFAEVLASSWRRAALVGALAVTTAGTACTDFHFSTSNLDIGPNPARPGDMVVAAFLLRLIPSQRHTIVVVIDDTEHLRVVNDGAPAVPVILELGDAADLIAKYGAGAHTVYVQVRAHEADETSRTRSTTLQLQPAAP